MCTSLDIRCLVSIKTLLGMSEKDHANRIPKRIRELWKANQDIEENMLPSFKTIDTSYSEVAI